MNFSLFPSALYTAFECRLQVLEFLIGRTDLLSPSSLVNHDLRGQQNQWNTWLVPADSESDPQIIRFCGQLGAWQE